MTTIESIQTATSGGVSLLPLAVQWAEIIGAIGLVIYVIFSYKTFKEIKKQTDYMLDAFLQVGFTIESDPSDISNNSRKYFKHRLNYIKNEVYQQWKKALWPHFEKDLEKSIFDGNNLVIIMTNYGKTTINSISIKATLIVDNTEENKKTMLPDTYDNLEFIIKEVIHPDESRKIHLFATAAFPYYDVTFDISYQDVRGKLYALPFEVYSNTSNHLIDGTTPK